MPMQLAAAVLLPLMAQRGQGTLMGTVRDDRTGGGDRAGLRDHAPAHLPGMPADARQAHLLNAHGS